jgi:hypothetical protein
MEDGDSFTTSPNHAGSEHKRASVGSSAGKRVSIATGTRERSSLGSVRTRRSTSRSTSRRRTSVAMPALPLQAHKHKLSVAVRAHP